MGSEILEDATVVTVENRIINEINHIKFVIKKNPPSTVYLQNYVNLMKGHWK